MENISTEVRICFKFSVQYFSSQDEFPYPCPISDRGKFRCILISACQLGDIWVRCCLCWGGLSSCAMQRSDLLWVAMGVTPAITWTCLAGAGWGLTVCWGFGCKRRDVERSCSLWKLLSPALIVTVCTRGLHSSQLDVCLQQALSVCEGLVWGPSVKGEWDRETSWIINHWGLPQACLELPVALPSFFKQFAHQSCVRSPICLASIQDLTQGLCCWVLPVYLQISLGIQTRGSFVQMWTEKTASVLEFIISVHEWDKELGIESILSPISEISDAELRLSLELCWEETKHYS